MCAYAVKIGCWMCNDCKLAAIANAILSWMHDRTNRSEPSRFDELAEEMVQTQAGGWR